MQSCPLERAVVSFRMRPQATPVALGHARIDAAGGVAGSALLRKCTAAAAVAAAAATLIAYRVPEDATGKIFWTAASATAAAAVRAVRVVMADMAGMEHRPKRK